MKHLQIVTLFLLLGLLLTACGNDVREGSMTTEQISLQFEEKGVVKRVHVTFNDENGNVVASDTDILWESLNPSVAEVKNGMVTAVGTGETTIEATAGKVTREIKVTVRIPAAIVIDTDNQKARFKDHEMLALLPGEQATLTAKVVDERAAVMDKKITWASNNPEVAVVDENTGVITAKAIGEAEITASFHEINRTIPIAVIEQETEKEAETPSAAKSEAI